MNTQNPIQINLNVPRAPVTTMQPFPQSISLAGRRGIVLGIANEASIAWGCARAMYSAGAQLALTYFNDKAKPHVQPLADEVRAPIFLPCDVEKPGELEALFEAAAKHWGAIDFVVHSIAFAPKADLQGRVVDSTREGFLRAMDVSCHSFLRMARLAEPMMPRGGCLLTMSYLGAEEVIEGYDLMGPVKAALECASRYVASELGPKGIRVHAISPGPLRTRAASALANFEGLISNVEHRAPLRHLVSIDDVGALAAFMVSDAAASITGGTLHVDGGYHILG
jgi:enoyl-[acyl-carrier protein] reductase I